MRAKAPFETAHEIEVAISRYFHARRNVVVPNVSWGLFPYEMDVLVLNHSSRYATEVEIKISVSDLKRDASKAHNHDANYNLIRRLYFAMPDMLRGHEELVPPRAGILYVDTKGRVKEFRPGLPVTARRWTFEEAYQLARLGTMRYWNERERRLCTPPMKEYAVEADDDPPNNH